MATSPRRRLVTANSESTISTATDVLTEDTVRVVIPAPYKLTLDNGSEVHYTAGIQTMPLEHFQHWFTRASGVVEAPAEDAPAA